MTKQAMDELGTIPKTSSHCVSDPDDTVDEATRQRKLNHAPSLDDRNRIFAITCHSFVVAFFSRTLLSAYVVPSSCRRG